MTAFQLAAIVLSLAAVFAWINYRFLRLPSTIGLMALALGFSLVLVLLDLAGVAGLHERARVWLEDAHFSDALLHGMLGLLLFAGALHVDLEDLARERLTVTTLAIGGTLLSTAIVALLGYYAFAEIGLPLAFGHCLVLGALISPTDPIAVIGILRGAGVPQRLEVQIAGESMFNDGVGVVVFTVALDVALGGGTSAGSVALLIAREAGGGAAFGLATGWVAYRMLRTVDHYQVEVLITLALVVAGYAGAEAVHVSAPIAAVVAGLLIGNQGRRFAMSETTRRHLDDFWELVDEILNAGLFVLIGLEVLVLQLGRTVLLAGAALVGVVLVARVVSVAVPVWLLRRRAQVAPHAITIMTWGGLRGGISVALALALPPSAWRDALVSTTYVVVVFSILVQGLSLGWLLRRLGGERRPAEASPR
jgi:CPA1 family monovalent cation:H+ antiporter